MTIYDIAAEAGVSASTVSRVFNHKSGIKQETREKVEELLKKYNYSPNVAARGLVTQSTKMIGILVVDIRVAHHIDNAFAIEQALAAKGYCSIILSTGTDEKQMGEGLKTLQQHRVEGLALIGSMFMTKSVYSTIKKYLPKTPVVVVNGYIDLPNVSGIIANETMGVTQCVELLISKGKQSIVYVNDAETPANINKKTGFYLGMQQTGISAEECHIYNTDSSIEGGYKITTRIMKELPKTDGIIFSVDLVAVGGLRALYDLGYNVPENVSVIGIDNSIYGLISTPKLTTLDNKPKCQSELAVDFLLSDLEGRLHDKKILLDTEIIERETT